MRLEIYRYNRYTAPARAGAIFSRELYFKPCTWCTADADVDPDQCVLPSPACNTNLADGKDVWLPRGGRLSAVVTHTLAAWSACHLGSRKKRERRRTKEEKHAQTRMMCARLLTWPCCDLSAVEDHAAL